MIWSCTPDGKVTYASPEWTDFTGQPFEEGLGYGWLKMVHPDDVEAAIEAYRSACDLVTTFTVSYRLHTSVGDYVHVIVGATPSLSPVDGTFLGYLGALSEIDAAGARVFPQIGSFEPHAPSPRTVPKSPVDIVADYLLLAKATAQANGEHRLLPSIDFAISEVMRRLGQTMAARLH